MFPELDKHFVAICHRVTCKVHTRWSNIFDDSLRRSGGKYTEQQIVYFGNKILYKFREAWDIGNLVLQNLIKTFLIFSSYNFQTRLHFLVLRKALRVRTPRPAVQGLRSFNEKRKRFPFRL